MSNRLLKNLTSKQTAKLIGVDENQYTNIEQGSKRGTIKLSNEEIANRLNFDVKEFEYNLFNCINQDLSNLKESYIQLYGDYPQGTTYREMNVFLRLLFKQPVSFEILNEELEMSRSSFKRAIAMLRGLLENSISLHGTIQYNSKKKTYYLVLSNCAIDFN